jgi:TetR/AcrR family transcriptional regulator, regulator of cefoperazone and chloramphenicol sensitivity
MNTATNLPLGPLIPREPGQSRLPETNAERAIDRGVLAREQLVAAATRIFAAKGYAAATTREICEAAGANVAAIHYYFGDKEGLYRAVLMRPIAEMADAFGRFDDPALSFEESMRMFLGPFLGDLARSDQCGDGLDAQVMRVHLREMIDPSKVFQEVIEQIVVPAHNALANVIARHCRLKRADADIHQLAFALVAMAHDYCMSRDFMKMLAPDVLNRPQAKKLILDRLVGYSRALLDHEIGRRQITPATERSSR